MGRPDLPRPPEVQGRGGQSRMSAAHGLGDAGGVLDGPARPAHFEIGRPPQPARSCRCRRMGTKEAGMGNYVNADICHRRDADRALARTSSNRLQHGLGGSHWTLVGRPAAAGQQAPPDRRPTPDPVRRLPERGNRHDVTQFMPLLKRPAPPSAPQAVRRPLRGARSGHPGLQGLVLMLFSLLTVPGCSSRGVGHWTISASGHRCACRMRREACCAVRLVSGPASEQHPMRVSAPGLGRGLDGW